MTVLSGIKSTTRDVADLTTGLGGIATAPLSDSKTVSGETKTYVKNAYATLFDGFLIIPSVGVGYLLLNPPKEDGDSFPFRVGKAASVGILAYALIFGVRNFGGWF